ncbi:hypothetical protein PV10_07241 [Exophiala mesophila]|uniref:Selenoprotein W-like protein n=1 Tax=Exophiala mesophila TaxID=212818 RepID=A0A0D1ZST6_EXOME|nr:uncharacterized protein PV10_07241 [Exophiala mesophila]KIV89873.1 hypothetical protein PV10_07241 [Exophiala mesophila]
MATEASSQVPIPRIAIRFCTQCKWNLRAAYFAQELLQTFSTSIGEVALIPVTGGIFTVTITHVVPTSEPAESSSSSVAVTETLLWDRKAEGGFPETKELKNRVRNVIEPGRDLGHIDRSLKKGHSQGQSQVQAQQVDAEPAESEIGKATETSPAVHDNDPGRGAIGDAQAKSGNGTKCEDCP